MNQYILKWFNKWLKLILLLWNFYFYNNNLSFFYFNFIIEHILYIYYFKMSLFNDIKSAPVLTWQANPLPARAVLLAS